MVPVNHLFSKHLSENLKRPVNIHYMITLYIHNLDILHISHKKAHIDLDFPIKVDQVILSGCYEDIGWFKKASVVEKNET